MQNLGAWVLGTILVLVATTWVAAVSVSMFFKKDPNEGEVVTALRNIVLKFLTMVTEGTGWKTLLAILGLVLINVLPDLEAMWRAILSVLDITVFTTAKAYQNKTIIERQSVERIAGVGLVAPQIKQNEVIPIEQPKDTGYGPPAVKQKPNVIFKPIPDTTVPFTEDDVDMPQALQDIVMEWFSRSATHKPTMPDVPPVTGVLPYQWENANEQRAEEADRIIDEEARSRVFPFKDLENAYKYRKDCSLKVWHRVNYLWRLAYQRWMDYGNALWKFEDARVNKPPEPRPQPEW